MRCIVCKKPATIRVEYAGVSFCNEHYDKHFIKKVEKTIRAYKMLQKGDIVLVGVSGGKDSVSLLHVLWRLKEKFDCEVIPLHISLGIGKYSEVSKRICEELCSRVGAKLVIVDLKKEYGVTLPELIKISKRPPCSICGIVKRHIISFYAVKLKATKIATGHNLIDEAIFLLGALTRSDMISLAKRSPLIPPLGNLPSKIKPLYRVYEYETLAYVKIHRLPYVEERCPYSVGATSIKIRSIIELLEATYPGYTLNLVKSWYKNIQPILWEKIFVESSIKKCKICGMPSQGEICSFCKLLLMKEKKAKEV